MSKNISPTENPISGNVNRTCEGTEIIGKIIASTDYRIDGKINGEIQCGGKIIVGDKGNIKGNIMAKNMEICGSVEGNIFVENVLTLKPNSIVNADISTEKIVIELGAQFNGNLKMPYQKSSKFDKPEKSDKVENLDKSDKANKA
ncbi:MAG: polymer-forming cytoskeletal protein [Prevotellaceae bacterium]|jgi:cytoskeletal protein CcmA (bactofilin family)|nr:polymer-forming cytoskeletal protein [Prevotellaceae bacterium]